MRPARIAVYLLALISSLSFAIFEFRTDAQLCQFIHLVAPPEDQYQPIVLARDLLRNPHGRYEYSFRPRYCDVYEIGFLSDYPPLSLAFDPGVRFQAWIRSERGDLIATIDRTKPTRISAAATGAEAGKVAFGIFDLPLREKIVTIEVDFVSNSTQVVDEISRLDLYVGVSPP